MYETRQAALQQDENKRCDVKPAKGNSKQYSRSINSRRALGDIGNVVSGGALGNNAAKEEIREGLDPEKKPICEIDRPVTRSFGAKLASNNRTSELELSKECSHGDDEAAAGINQRKTHRKQDSFAEGNDQCSKHILAGHPVRVKALLNQRNGKSGIANNRRRKSLTSTLTARSEAACGGFKAEPEEEPVPDIDAEDVGNQLAVVDYVEDIYSFYRRAEPQSFVDPNYMFKQSHINDKMRAILIDWLIEVHLKFKLLPETLFLTSNVIDRYLEIQSVERKHLQLVGMTAMLVAAKYEEIWAPEIEDFISISDGAYERQHMLDMEKTMLNTLRFNFCVPTPYMFLVRFLKAASSNEQMHMLAFYYVELSLVDYRMVKFSPSMLAASAVYIARLTVKVDDDVCWNAALQRHTGYTQNQLLECVQLMASLHQKAGEGSLTAVCRKYSHEKFGSVAVLSPSPALSGAVLLQLSNKERAQANT